MFKQRPLLVVLVALLFSSLNPLHGQDRAEHPLTGLGGQPRKGLDLLQQPGILTREARPASDSRTKYLSCQGTGYYCC